MATRKKFAIGTLILALVCVICMPFFILFGESDAIIVMDTALITGSFTLPNPVRDVTVELRQSTSDGVIVATTIAQITPASNTSPASFTFDAVVSGVYSLVFHKPGHTSFTLNNVHVAGDDNLILNTATGFPDMLPLYPGNITGNGQINILDLNLLLQYWMTDNMYANISASGQVNVQDLNLLLAHWMHESVVASADAEPTPQPTPGMPTPTPEPGAPTPFPTSTPPPTPSPIPTPTLTPIPTPTPSTIPSPMPPTPSPSPTPTPWPPTPSPPPPTPTPPADRIVLPNRQLTEEELLAWVAEYQDLGGPTAFELELVAAINEYRWNNGQLPPLTIHPELMLAARFHSQTLADLGFFPPGTHVAGPYGGSLAVAELFGQWRGHAIMASNSNVQAVINLWSTSPGHRDAMLLTTATYIGLGSSPRPGGGMAHYAMISPQANPLPPHIAAVFQ